jgi:hypothetical protein
VKTSNLNEEMRVIQRLATRTGSLGKAKKRSIFGDDSNPPYADWKGNVDGTSGGQTFFDRLEWENGSTRGDALPDVYLVRPESIPEDGV